jgi:glycosyltransferase involved in cell wall biosynthesis
MPTWKCREFLTRAISSVVRQTYSAVNLYVADDASGDLDSELMNRFPEVTFLEMRDQGGPYRIDNLLLSITESEYVAFHDADDCSVPYRFAAQITFLTGCRLDGCGSWCLHVDLNGDPVGFDSAPGQSGLPYKGAITSVVFHPATLYRRHVFDILSGFDTSTRFSADTEFIWRAHLNFSLANVAGFLYRRTVRPSSLTQNLLTGIHTPSREAYGNLVREKAIAIMEGRDPPPAPGFLTTGRPVEFPEFDCVRWIRPGNGNTTLRDISMLPRCP